MASKPPTTPPASDDAWYDTKPWTPLTPPEYKRTSFYIPGHQQTMLAADLYLPQNTSTNSKRWLNNTLKGKFLLNRSLMVNTEANTTT